MALHPASQLRKVSIISDEKLDNIKTLLHGRVDSWIEDQPDRWFAARDLVSGDWDHYPALKSLRDAHLDSGKSEDDAFKQAGIDIGWILKSLLHEDTIRTFEQKNDEQNENVKSYKLKCKKDYAHS